MLEKTKSCSMLPFRMLRQYYERFRIVPLDLNVELTTRNAGFWTSSAGRDRLEVVDFHKRLVQFIEGSGLA
jgi:hypothetical protein